MTGERLLFRVIANGREFSIFTNGRTEGFGDQAMVFNYFPNLLRDSMLRFLPQQEGPLHRPVDACKEPQHK